MSSLFLFSREAFFSDAIEAVSDGEIVMVEPALLVRDREVLLKSEAGVINLDLVIGLVGLLHLSLKYFQL